MHRQFLVASALLGCSAVAMGAFGAHGLSASLEGQADGVVRLGWWKTAASYHLSHALALALSASGVGQLPAGRAACWAFVLGIGLFSGSLYAMTLGAPRWFGAITPFGGLSLMAGWLALAWAGWRLSRD